MKRTLVLGITPVFLAGWMCACAPREEQTQGSPAPESSALQSPATVTTPSVPIADRDWELVELGGVTDLRGSSGRSATLRLDSATSRATGFAGCNRFNASFRIAGDSLTIEDAVSTKMACDRGMELESRFLAALPEVRTYALVDSVLTLNGAGGPLARFRAP
jgi:putative lipoprotein